MTSTAPASAPSLAVLTQRVTNAASQFPGDGLVPGPADAQNDLVELLPADDPFVVVVPLLTGVPEHLVIVVTQQLLAPLGVTEAGAVPSALAAVVSELANGVPLDEEGIRVGVGPDALDGLPTSADPDGTLVAAGLFLGAEHVATVGVAVRAVPDDGAEDRSSIDLPDLGKQREASTPRTAEGGRSLDLLRNVEMNLTAELGRSRMTVAELLSLTPGSVVELDRAAGSPIDLLVNGTLIARGEVVVIDEEFGVRISEIVDRAEGA